MYLLDYRKVFPEMDISPNFGTTLIQILDYSKFEQVDSNSPYSYTSSDPDKNNFKFLFYVYLLQFFFNPYNLFLSMSYFLSNMLVTQTQYVIWFSLSVLIHFYILTLILNNFFSYFVPL